MSPSLSFIAVSDDLLEDGAAAEFLFCGNLEKLATLITSNSSSTALSYVKVSTKCSHKC